MQAERQEGHSDSGGSGIGAKIMSIFSKNKDDTPSDSEIPLSSQPLPPSFTPGSSIKAVPLQPTDELPSVPTHPVGSIPQARKSASAAQEGSRVTTTRLLKPQEVEVGMTAPQYSSGTEFSTGEALAGYSEAPATPPRPTYSPALPYSPPTGEPTGKHPTPLADAATQGVTAGTAGPSDDPAVPKGGGLFASAHANPLYRAEGAEDSLAGKEEVAQGLQAPATPAVERSQGAAMATPVGPVPVPEAETVAVRPGRVGGVAAASEGSQRVGTPATSEGEPPSPVQGDRVKVERKEEGPLQTGAERMQEIPVRPDSETRPLTAEEIAAMKEREHALMLTEAQRTAQEKQRAAIDLKRQAELLEVETQNLLAEASQEKMKVDQHLQKKETVEQREVEFYVAAEEAERHRRQVVERAAPLAQQAEQREEEALRLRQQAADTEYHAKILEDKAKALLMESTDLAALVQTRMGEAEQLAAEHMLAQQEVQEVKLRLAEITAGDLPTYKQECLAEMGRLQARMNELREEVLWADLQMEEAQQEGWTWERLVLTKQGVAGQLLLRVNDAKSEAELARLRSRQAAEEAREPTSLAEAKYEEAYRLSQHAAEFEQEAARLHQEAMQIVEEAHQPEQTRQENLREAGQAELMARQIEAQASLVAERAQARLYEAEVKAQTAAQLAQKAQLTEGELAAVQRLADQQKQMAEAYGAQKERHAASPSLFTPSAASTSEPRAPTPLPLSTTSVSTEGPRVQSVGA